MLIFVAAGATRKKIQKEENMACMKEILIYDCMSAERLCMFNLSVFASGFDAEISCSVTL